jgi:hypothetical protein
VDFLLSKGVGCVCVLDISAAALEKARARLGDSTRRVPWIEALPHTAPSNAQNNSNGSRLRSGI